MTEERRNMIIAIVLSMFVLLGWQIFILGPQQEELLRQQELREQAQADLAAPGSEDGEVGGIGGVSTATNLSRTEAIAQSTTRITIDTRALEGSINPVGARIDDLSLRRYRESVDENSDIIHLLAPANSVDSYYAEQGWINAQGKADGLPGPDTIWSVKGNATLTAENPVVLEYDNGEGLVFERTIAVDQDYLFTFTDNVRNETAGDVVLFPYSRITRKGIPNDLANFFILHEGPIGVMGGSELLEKSYGDVTNDVQIETAAIGGWLGFTDKYWATAIMPEDGTNITTRFVHLPQVGTDGTFIANYVQRDPVAVSAGSSSANTNYLFAGAKVESIIDTYEREYGFDSFELMIDWGWFHFITKPMFLAIRWLNGVLGNFGLAILAVTLGVKIIFFPLANRSYASMAKMRVVQPKMKEIQERYAEDRAEQQKQIMELYRKEKINPVSGCWPMLLQIPIFFSLYKVLFVTIEMRHAPFFGWIMDLAEKDPTNIFNLFGLIPFDPTIIPAIGPFLHLGIWPIIMGVSMWVQMKLNPAPTDQTQAMIFTFMPIIFTFMLGSFPAGLVIYWAWNNVLSVIQQYYIMRRHGAEVNLLGNIRDTFRRKPAE